MVKNTGSSKSFGLAGAKRAGERLRKLFGRQSSPAGTDAGTENGTDSEEGAANNAAAGVIGGTGKGNRNENDDRNADSQGKSGSDNLRANSSRDPNNINTNIHLGNNNSNHNHTHKQSSCHQNKSAGISNTSSGDSAFPSSHSAQQSEGYHPGTDLHATAQRDFTPSSLDPQTTSTSNNATITDNMANRDPDHGLRPDQQPQGRKMSAQSRVSGKENHPFSGFDHDKENQPPADPGVAPLATAMRRLSVSDAEKEAALIVDSGDHPIDLAAAAAYSDDEAEKVVAEEDLTEEELTHRAEREKHLVFIEEALDMARLALRINETPVGCVLVHNEKVIARGMNATNVTRNGTRHAEFMALCALLSHPPKDGPRTTSLKPNAPLRKVDDDSDDNASIISRSPYEGNDDGRKSHLYPYGQKDHPDEIVDRAILRECTLYVTVEPCVMCASLLRQLGIRKVFFGAVNDKFGGTGGVFSIHANSLPISEDGQTASAHPQPAPMRLPDGKEVLGTSFPVSGGDGGNVEAGYEIEGGWGRDEAVGLLRRFYVQENGRAPVPRKKEGRAARLAAMMEKDDDGSVNSGSVSGGTQSDGDDANIFTDRPSKSDLMGGVDG